jgi:DNA-binding YbaB/EbfC family protein
MNPFDIFKQAGKFQEIFKNAQADLLKIEVVGEAGAGMVKVIMNGRNQVLKVIIEEEIYKEGPEVLQEVVAAAMRDAISKVEETVKQKMGSMFGGMLPGNFNFPFGQGDNTST